VAEEIAGAHAGGTVGGIRANLIISSLYESD